jgi:hypothetical protein
MGVPRIHQESRVRCAPEPARVNRTVRWLAQKGSKWGPVSLAGDLGTRPRSGRAGKVLARQIRLNTRNAAVFTF